MLRHPLRVLIRLAGFLAICFAALFDAWWNISRRGKSNCYRARSQWMHRWGKAMASCIGLETKVQGKLPGSGMLVCNHLSYLDVIAIASLQPLILVSKADVGRWPLIGWLTRCGGTLFIKRESKADLLRVASEFQPVIDQGVVIGLFPEGTSSDGSAVLPFRSSLLAPAVENNWPVTPAWIGYRLEDGDVGQEVAYWADMTFFPHLLNLFSKRRIYATVAAQAPITGALDRKQLASALHEDVDQLRQQFSPAMKAVSERESAEVEDGVEVLA